MARVLIVDDSPTEMYRLTEWLEKHGYEVLKANNGADGVALARQEKPDAVLMDIVMPGMNGFQATRQLSKDPQTAGIPVVIVTTTSPCPRSGAARISDSVQKLLSLSPDRVALYGYAHVPWMARRQQMIPSDTLPRPEERLSLFDTARRLFTLICALHWRS